MRPLFLSYFLTGIEAAIGAADVFDVNVCGDGGTWYLSAGAVPVG